MRPHFAALLVTGLLSTGLRAQITITAGENLPAVGQTFTYNTAAYAAPPAGGADQVFNFSGLTSTGTTEFNWISPTEYSEPSMYPTAQMASATAQDTVFYAVTTEGLERVGERKYMTLLGNELDLKIVHSDNMLDLKLPLTANQSWLDQVEGTVDSDGSMGDRSGVIQGSADAYGTIQLPGGIDSPVLRVYTKINETVEITISGTPANVVHKRHQYDYYVPWLKMPILTSYMDTMTYIFTITESGIRYMTEAPVGVSDENTRNDNGFTLFPNPAANRIELLHTKTFTGGKLEVFDATGKVVMARTLGAVADQRRSIDVQALPAGLYTVRLTGPSGSTGVKQLTIVR